MEKYELTVCEKEVSGVKVFQIKALKDIPFHGIKAGDFGGWVDNMGLSQEGNCWLMPDAVMIDSTVKGDTLVTEGIIEGSTLLAEKVGCRTIKDSVINGKLIVIDGKSSLVESQISTNGFVEINEASELYKCNVFGKDIRICGASILTSTVIRAKEVIINRKSRISSTRLDGESLYILGSQVSGGSDIDGLEIIIRFSEVNDFKIKGEDISLKGCKMKKGRMVAKRLVIQGETDIFNTHIEGDVISWDGDTKVHNCYVRGNRIRIEGKVDVEWVYFVGDDIQVDGVIDLVGRNETDDFRIETNSTLDGIISMKVDKNLINLKGDQLKGDIQFVS